jgi:UDP-N-acetylglucosamine--N-acetylmuramyl-(pentapeptide) pyrophosphoryl-undecaprenol N-acetylglucosamine transferase
LANRLIAPFVQRAYTAFEGTERHFARAAILRTGVPLRKGFEPQPYRHRSGAPFGVLVLGGSQGAQTLNDAVPRALARVAHPVRVVHQAGGGRDAGVRALYGELGREAEVLPFIDDMPAALAAADLVIGRAGASAVAEVCAVGRPAIFVPYPHAGDHQKYNARAVADANAAVCLLDAEATVERLASEVDRLAAEPNTLSSMAARARSLGQPHSASVIALDFLRLSGLAAPSESTGRGSAHVGPAALEEAI